MVLVSLFSLACGYSPWLSDVAMSLGRRPTPRSPASSGSSSAPIPTARARGSTGWCFDTAIGQALGAGAGRRAIEPVVPGRAPDGKNTSTRSTRAPGPGKGGGVTAFALDAKTGALTKLNQESTVGDGPCHLVVDADGQERARRQLRRRQRGRAADRARRQARPASDFVQHKGKVFDPKRQGAPHAHSINLDKANRFAVVADLGLDRVFVYKFDPANGKLTPNDPPSTKVKNRSGPRHFAFHPDGKHAYVINEIDCTVTAFDYDPDHGTLTAIQTIPTMPVAVEPRHSTAEVVVHPSGKFLYGSNRGHDSLAVYAIEPGTGRLKLVEIRADPGQDPAQLRHRPDRLVPAGREHGLRHDRGLQGRPRDGSARADRADRRGAGGLLREVRADHGLKRCSPLVFRSQPIAGSVPALSRIRDSAIIDDTRWRTGGRRAGGDRDSVGRKNKENAHGDSLSTASDSRNRLPDRGR